MKIKKLYRIVVVLLVSAGLCFISGCNLFSSNTVSPTITPIVVDNLSKPAINVTWISPGKVEIGNFYHGATAEYNLEIHNGNIIPTKYSIKLRYPDYVDNGSGRPVANICDMINCSYDNMTGKMNGTVTCNNCFVFSGLPDCVTFVDNDGGDFVSSHTGNYNITLSAHETANILVSFTLPNSDVVPNNWEFWISVIDDSQTGFVRTELCSRWILSMR